MYIFLGDYLRLLRRDLRLLRDIILSHNTLLKHFYVILIVIFSLIILHFYDVTKFLLR